MARIERMLGHSDAARRRPEEAVSACAQPGITHSNHLAGVLLESGHVVGAEQDWLRARQHYAEVLAGKGHSAAEVHDLRQERCHYLYAWLNAKDIEELHLVWGASQPDDYRDLIV